MLSWPIIPYIQHHNEHPCSCMLRPVFFSDFVTPGQHSRACIDRIGLTRAVMMSLKQIWNDKHPTLDTKLRIYQTLVLSVLLYAADTWTLLDLTVRTLGPCHQKCLKQLLGIQWYDRVQNDEVLQRTFTVPSAIPSTHLVIWARGST